MNTSLSRRWLSRLSALVPLCAGIVALGWAIAGSEPQAVAAAPQTRHEAAPRIPLPTLLSPIYTDTYESNNFQSTAYNLNPGFPYASIQCGASATFTDASPLIDNATFWQSSNPSFDVDWYNIELAANYFFTISIRNKVSGSPIVFNVQLKSPSNADVAPAPVQGAAPNIAFYTSQPGGRYQLGLAVYNASSVSGTENYPYQIYVCSTGPVAPTATPIPTNTPTATPSGPLILSADSLEPNDTITVAGSGFGHVNGLPSFIAVGQTIGGLNFSPGTEKDYVYFYARGGSVYEVSTENVQPGVETILTVYNPVANDTTLPTSLAGPNSGSSNPNNRWQNGARGSKVAFTSPADGVVWLLVTNSDQSPRTASQTYALKVIEILPATPTLTPIVPTPTSFPGTADRLEYNGSFDYASLIAPGTKIDGLNFVPINPSSSPDTDNDYFKLPVKQGVFYTCETDDLGGGADTNIIVYNGDRVGIGGNDDISADERSKGNFRSRFPWLSSYTGNAYVLVGQVNPTGASESGGRTYSLRCTIGLPNTPTPRPTSTPFPGSGQPYVPPTPLPPEPTPTPFPTNRPAQNLVFRPVDPGRLAVATPTPQPPPRAVTIDLAVFLDINKNLADDLNEGVGGVSIRVADEQSGAPLAQVMTDPSGRARISVLNEGPVRLSVPLFGASILVRDTSVLVNIAINAQPELPDRLP